MWVLDLDGTVVVISTGVWPEPSAGADPDFAADVLDSIRIDPLRALFGTPDEHLAPGTYYLDEVDGTPTARIFATIGTGWTNLADRSGLAKHGPGEPSPPTPEDDIGFITFSRPDQVYLDACHLDDGFHPGPVTTLDGLVAALSEQQGWADVTPPTDISVDGYPGKTFQRTAPACSRTAQRCRWAHERSRGRWWRTKKLAERRRSELRRGVLRTRQVETLIVLDIDGTVVVINANLWAGTSAADRARVRRRARLDPHRPAMSDVRGCAVPFTGPRSRRDPGPSDSSMNTDGSAELPIYARRPSPANSRTTTSDLRYRRLPIADGGLRRYRADCSDARHRRGPGLPGAAGG